MHQCNLLLRIAAGHRDDGSADILGTGMRTQSTGKKSVTVGHLENIRATGTIGSKGP